MKKRLNGKSYNTETAREIAWWSNDSTTRNFSRYEVTLYRKRTGEHFLYCIGGPSSPFCKRVGQDEYVGGEEILPISDKAATLWEKNKGKCDLQEFEGISARELLGIAMTYRENLKNKNL